MKENNEKNKPVVLRGINLAIVSIIRLVTLINT